MGLTDRVSSAWKALTVSERAWPTISWDDYFSLLNFNGNTYLTGGLNQTLRGETEEMDASFAGLVEGAYKSNGIVFAVMMARMRIFRQGRYRFQELRNGEPGKFFGTPALALLEHPWPNGTQADLLSRAIQDADLSGNAFFARRQDNAIRRLRPDWMTFVLGSERDPDVEAGDIDAEVLGYLYHPGGKHSGRPVVPLLTEQVAHFAPIPDPVAAFRGMSWLTPILREIGADKQMTEHKQAYLLNGATPNLVVSLDKDMQQAATPTAFMEWIDAFKKLNPSGSQWDKFKTWYMAGGTTVTKVGGNFQEIDFKAVQGGGETRIAAAGGVPPIVVGLSEGLAAATYSNYGQARRAFTDNTIRDLWQDFGGSMETLVRPPDGSRLWVDDRHIPALAEDKKDQAEIHQLESQQIRTLIDGGFEAQSVIDAVTTGDFNRLKHTGLVSVQLLPPQPEGPPKTTEVAPVKALRDRLAPYLENPTP